MCLQAGQRLLSVIQKNEGIPNKDLAKFADQINSLADKWDRQEVEKELGNKEIEKYHEK